MTQELAHEQNRDRKDPHDHRDPPTDEPMTTRPTEGGRGNDAGQNENPNVDFGQKKSSAGDSDHRHTNATESSNEQREAKQYNSPKEMPQSRWLHRYRHQWEHDEKGNNLRQEAK